MHRAFFKLREIFKNFLYRRLESASSLQARRRTKDIVCFVSPSNDSTVMVEIDEVKFGHKY